MIKINILNQTNLTMLAKAYWDEILPTGKQGEVFYDKNDKNDIDSIYFKNSEYFHSLLEYIEENKSDFLTSNAANEWQDLFDILHDYTEVKNIDFGYLEHYELAKSTFEEKEIDKNILNNKHINRDPFLINMKRLYKGYSVTYWGNKNFIVIKLPFHFEHVFNFDLKPALDLIDKYKVSLKTFNIYRDPNRNLTVIRLEIKN